MKRVLILSYFFPPCNLTASQRAYSWARYLKGLGYFPVIITRRWDVEIEEQKFLSGATRPGILHEVHDHYEVYYLPYKPNMRDRIYFRYGEHRFTLLRKMYSLWEILSQNLTNQFIPFRNMFHFSDSYLKAHPDTCCLIATGHPFILFKFAYLLNKKFSVPWIADYRDAWTTSTISKINRGYLAEAINIWDRRFEKKWCRTATAVTSVSGSILKGIKQFIGVSKGEVIENGYFEDEIPPLANGQPGGPFTITYVGTLFSGQQPEMFEQAFRRFVSGKNPEQVRLKFLGLGYLDTQVSRIRTLYAGLESFIEITSRIPRGEALKEEKQSHVMLHFAWKNFSGIIGSKLYEYIALGKPIIICPSDEDIVEQILTPYNMAFICKSEDDALKYLNHLYTLHCSGRYHELVPDAEYQARFTRFEQTKKLANLLDAICNETANRESLQNG